MTAGLFLSRAIVASVVMAALYVVYKAAMSRINAPALMRSAILGIYAVSILAAITGVPLPATLTSGQIVVINVVADESTSTISMTRIAVILYLVGVAVMLLATTVAWLRVWRVVARGSKVTDSRGVTITLLDNDSYSPFSWMGRIVMSRRDYETAPASVVYHEMQHVALRHRYDLAIAQIFLILDWFNPAAWLLLRQLRQVHEYQADRRVLDSGADEREYQLLLISRAARCHFPTFTSALSRSPLRDRIVIMQRDATKGAAWRLFFLLPGLLCAGLLLASPGISGPLHALDKVSAVNMPQKAACTPDISVDGVLIPMEDVEKIDPSQIKSIAVSKDLPDHPDGLIIVEMKK